ncbi:MAG: alpha-2-macroglobulin family protein [Bacteroidales bacterium]|nr:alpha-2-macroglobulin family protein [Bacteroidales bacterium]
MFKIVLQFVVPAALLTGVAFWLSASRLHPATDQTIDHLWHQADSLKAAGQPKAAMDVLARILSEAARSGNQPQLARALLYNESLRSSFDEGYITKSIAGLEEWLPRLQEPVRQIISSALGDLYRAFYNANQYELLQRTRTQTPGTDLNTWDARQVIERASFYFRQSLSNPGLLQATSTATYDAVLLRDSLPGDPLPTLFDVLTFRAIEHFADEHTNLSAGLPVGFPDGRWLAPATGFVALVPDTSTTTGYLMELYRQAIAFHLRDKDPSPLLDADLRRIEFVYNKLTNPQRDTLYLDALLALESRYRNFHGTTRVTSAIARHYVQLADRLPDSLRAEADRLHRQALTKADQAVALFPDSQGATDCRRLRDELLRPSLVVNLPDAVLPQTNFLVNLTSSNTDTLWFRLYRLTAVQMQALQVASSDKVRDWRADSKTLYKEWSQESGNPFPTLRHSQYYPIGELPQGAYLLKIAGNRQFSTTGQYVATGIVQATRLAWIQPPATDTTPSVIVVDRLTGFPLEKVNTVFKSSTYDRLKGKWSISRQMEKTTGADGVVLTQPARSGRGYFIELSKGADFYYPRDEVYFSHSINREPQPRQNSWIFTDRAIYRPGQPVWFKAIVMTGADGVWKADANREVVVSLYDANNQLADKMSLTSNEFGSVSGNFVLPTGKLAGNFRITTGTGSKSFRVEAYKRPEFAVTFKPLHETWKPGDTVTLEGAAEAFSGYAVEGARVSYTVSRSDFSVWWRWIQKSSEVTATGETTTRSDGTFSIAFATQIINQPGEQLPKDFYYTIKATVTDKAGESHEASETVQVLSRNLFIEARVEELLNRRTLKPIEVKAVSAAGEPVPATIGLTLQKLVQPDDFYWPRQQTDPYLISNYAADRDYSRWRADNEPVVWQMNCPSDSLADLAQRVAEPGVYRLAIHARDAKGNTTTSTFYFTLYDEASSLLPLRTPDWIVQLDKQVVKGHEVRFLVGSSERDARYLMQVCRRDGVVEQRWIETRGRQQLIVLPPSVTLGGDVQVHLLLVRNNHFFNHSFRVLVTDPERALTTRLTTFRDKTAPGEKEQWSMTVTNGNSKPLEAEIVAALYDATLDAYAPNLFAMNTSPYPWQGGSWSSGAFRFSNADTDYSDTTRYTDKPLPGYTQLNWFDYQFFAYFMPGRLMMGKAAGNRTELDGAVFSVVDNAVELEEVTPSQKKIEFTADAAKDEEPGNDKQEENGGGQQPEALRRNLNETAFFYPMLKSAADGSATFDFVMPDALTRWKFIALAHTRDGLAGSTTQLVTSSRDVMVIPAFPRFVRQGDSLALPVRVVNLTAQPIQATVSLSLFDGSSSEKLFFGSTLKPLAVSVPATGNTVVEWPITVDGDPGLIRYEVTATAGNQSDGQTGWLPLLTNQTLVTNTKAFTLKGKETFSPDISSLACGKALQPTDKVKIAIEYTSNPAWMVVKALPTLRSATVHRVDDALLGLYSTLMGQKVMAAFPEIRQTLEVFRKQDMQGGSPLTVNNDLKITTTDETPWVMEATDETLNQQRLSLFFDPNNIRQFQKEAFGQLKSFQHTDGSFSWCQGMPGSRYLTTRVVETLGKLVKADAWQPASLPGAEEMLSRAIEFLDEEMLDDYNQLLKLSKGKRPAPDASQLHYLYARSYFFSSHPVAEKYREAFRYYQEGIASRGTGASPMLQAMTALALYRAGDEKSAEKIRVSLADKALTDSEGNWYWRREYGQRWYDAPLETQAAVMEAWNELRPASAQLDLMKGWLLSRKRTEAWENQPATAAACYAFLLSGNRELLPANRAAITINGKRELMADGNNPEGYFRKDYWITADEAARMKIEFSGNGTGTGWGGVYAQFWSPVEDVKGAESGFELQREVMRFDGVEARALKPGEELRKGDKLKVRLLVKVHRDMEFVTLRDQRACALEPTGVLSGYTWSDGAGYYQVTGDEAVTFYFYQLRKGTYVLDYDVNVTREGSFSDGPATIQSQYAPAFSGRSEGGRLQL